MPLQHQFLAATVDCMKLFKRTVTDKATGEVKEISNKWWYRFEFNKETYTASTRLTNYKEALKVATAARNKAVLIDAGLVAEPKVVATVPTLLEFTSQFLNFLQPRVARRTWRYYSDAWQHILNHAPLAGACLSDVNAALIDGFVQAKLAEKTPMEAVTINHSLQTLRRCVHVAEELGIILKAPKIRLLKADSPRDYVISEEVLQKFLKLCKPRDPDYDWWLPREQMDVDMKPLLSVLFDTGMRIGEAVRLEWSDISFNRRGSVHVRHGKSKNAKRYIPLTARARGVLSELKKAHETAKKTNPKASPAVFTHNGQPITVTWASHNFTWARRKLGLPDSCTLHSTRHSYLTRLGAAGADAFTISKIAGHATIQQSQHYVHPSEARLESTVALLD